MKNHISIGKNRVIITFTNKLQLNGIITDIQDDFIVIEESGRKNIIMKHAVSIITILKESEKLSQKHEAQ